jgi:hypothetical protein
MEMNTDKKRATQTTKVAKTGLNLMPTTPKTFKRTKRLLFSRRMSFMDRPLIVICFQGVLGDFCKNLSKAAPKETVAKHKFERMKSSMEEKIEGQVLQSQWNNLNLRQGAIEGLKYLTSCFQLVIFSRETIEDSWG